MAKASFDARFDDDGPEEGIEDEKAELSSNRRAKLGRKVRSLLQRKS